MGMLTRDKCLVYYDCWRVYEEPIIKEISSMCAMYGFILILYVVVYTNSSVASMTKISFFFFFVLLRVCVIYLHFWSAISVTLERGDILFRIRADLFALPIILKISRWFHFKIVVFFFFCFTENMVNMKFNWLEIFVRKFYWLFVEYLLLMSI